MANSRAIAAGRGEVRLSADNSQLVKGLRAAQRQLDMFGRNVGKIGAAFTAAGAAIVGGLGAAVMAAAGAGDELDKMAGRTGMTVENLSELAHMASRSGTNLGAVEAAAKRMAKVLRDADRGLSTATDALDALGLSVEDLRALNPDQQFAKLTEAIAAIEDPSRRAALAQEVFGRGGTALLPMIANMAALRAEAQRLGQTMSTEDAASAAKFTDALGDLRAVLARIVQQVGFELMDAFTEILRVITNILVPVIAWIKANKELVVIVLSAGVALLAMGGAISAVAMAALFAKAVIAGLLAVISALSAVMAVLTSPITVAIFVVAALVALLVRLWAQSDQGIRVLGALAAWFRTAAAEVREFFGALWNAISAGDWSAAIEIVTSLLSLGFTSTINYLEGVWDTFMDYLYDLWLGTTLAMKDLWNVWSDFAEDIIIRLVGVGDRELSEQMARIAEQERNARFDEEADQAMRRRQERDAEGEERRAARAAEGEAAMAAYRAALAAAKAAESAAKASKAAATDTPDPDVVGDQVKSTTALGTFSAFAAQRMAGGVAMDRMARAAQQTATNTARTNDLLQDMEGMAFE